MRTVTALVVLLLLLTVLRAAEAPTKLDCEPTSHYDRRKMQGWQVFVNRRLLEDEKKLGSQALELLRVKLYDINRAVPASALQKLHAIPIWLELNDKGVRCACFHPSKAWLSANGYNPEKAGAVEIGDAATFLKWTHEQPSMVLHELAHAYHYLYLGGYDNPQIAAAYRRVVESKSYESVLYFNGRMKRAYVLNNPQEYFAELTEAWFGSNDFYPFVRAEVLKHDPEMAKLLTQLWGE
jgi:hypothetical protein